MPSVSARNGVRLFILITLWMSGNIKSSPGILGRCSSIPWFPVPESGCRNSRPRSLQGVARTTLSRSGLSVRSHGPRILLDVRRFPSILRPCNPITPISRVGQEASERTATAQERWEKDNGFSFQSFHLWHHPPSRFVTHLICVRPTIPSGRPSRRLTTAWIDRPDHDTTPLQPAYPRMAACSTYIRVQRHGRFSSGLC